jgi:hypothetical protein
MTDDDSPWKEVLERYFAAFTAFFFPAVHEGIDWERGHAFLENSCCKEIRMDREVIEPLAFYTPSAGFALCDIGNAIKRFAERG